MSPEKIKSQDFPIIESTTPTEATRGMKAIIPKVISREEFFHKIFLDETDPLYRGDNDF